MPPGAVVAVLGSGAGAAAITIRAAAPWRSATTNCGHHTVSDRRCVTVRGAMMSVALRPVDVALLEPCTRIGRGRES